MKIVKIAMAGALALTLAACSSSAPAGTDEGTDEPVAETGTGVYTIWNTTGEKLVELYVHEGEDKGTNYAEGGLNNNSSVEITIKDVPADTAFTLEFKTESGYKGLFDTLHVEETAIAIPAAELLSGSTPIVFGDPELTAQYTIYNLTGEKVTELYLYEEGSDKGENLAGDGLADKASQVLEKTEKASETLSKVYHLEFTTESGYSAAFETLHFEWAPISLLAQDALTGATPISFSKP